MNNFFKLSMRSKIILMVLVVSFMIAGGGLFAITGFAKDYEKMIYANMSKSANILSEKISAQFFERYGDIQAFAVNPAVRELNIKKIPSYLDNYSKLYGIYDLILVVDKNGKYVGSSTTDINGKPANIEKLKTHDFSQYTWFQNAKDGKWTSDKSKNFDGTLFEDIHVDPIYQVAFSETKTGTAFTGAITNEAGEFVGVITNRTNNKWFENEMKTVFLEWKQKGFDDAEVTLLNKDGFVIANLAPKNYDNKLVFDTDLEKIILKENFIQEHVPAGTAIQNKENTAVASKHGEDWDIIGFNFINDDKFMASIGWTTAVHLDKDRVLEPALHAKNEFYLLSGIFTFIGLAIAVWFSLALSKSVNALTTTLGVNSQDVSEASNKIASQSTELSESATEQAAALQETVAAVDEISAMVEKNAEAANKSKEVSSQSRETAMRGRQIVENMLHAIGEINQQNDEISEQMDQSNKQLNEITKLINDIGSKTKVINEIVFQTKLLSFNASVEAARAGEYGKGFAVVAEEVGNLAQMSGNAAKEITDMLEQSVRQVETIVGETKTKVERLMSESRKKVEQGTLTAKECNEALEEILNNVSSVDTLVSEIAVASQEQSTGIREISKAVGQMEEVTQQNSSVAQSSSTSAEQLRAQSAQLNSIVEDLVEIVHGDKSKFKFKQHSDEKRDTQKNNVVKFHKKEKQNFESAPEPMKKASGSDYVPSANDPGFGE
jgi:methyl-accepting chemotaxis protein